MNKDRRTKLQKAGILLTQALSVIEDVKNDETYAFDNIPENLHETDRYQEMEDGIADMEEICGLIEECNVMIDKLSL